MRERVEAETPMTGRKVTSRRSRYAQREGSNESSDKEESGENLKGQGNICLCMSVPC